jgi:hypothetical protein
VRQKVQLMRKRIAERKYTLLSVPVRDGLAGRLHMELRHPEIGVSIEEKRTGKRISIVLGTDPVEFRGELLNGAIIEVTDTWIDHAIEQLQIAKRMYLEEQARTPVSKEPPWKFPNVIEAIKTQDR